MAVKMKHQGGDILLMTRDEYERLKLEVERNTYLLTSREEVQRLQFNGLPIYILEDEVKKVKRAASLWQRLIELLHRDVSTLVKLPNWFDKPIPKKYGDWRDDHG